MLDFIKAKSPQEGYVRSKFREARDENGWITGTNRIETIAGLAVVDVITGDLLKIDPLKVRFE